MRSDCAFGIDDCCVLGENRWGTAHGGTPPNAHPGQSAGTVIWNFAPIPCEAISWEAQASRGQAFGAADSYYGYANSQLRPAIQFMSSTPTLEMYSRRTDFR
jgi:hypothetical protein